MARTFRPRQSPHWLSLRRRAQSQEANHGDRQSHRTDRGPRGLSRGSLQLQQRRVRAVVPGRYSPAPQLGAGQSRAGALLHPGRLRRAGPVVALLSHLRCDAKGGTSRAMRRVSEKGAGKAPFL